MSNQAAVALAKRRMVTMTPAQRSAVARLGALAMWKKKRAQAKANST